MSSSRTLSSFVGVHRVASGNAEDTVRATKKFLDSGEAEALEFDAKAPLLIFDEETGRQVNFDFRGTLEDVMERIHADPEFAPAVPRVGRPRLGAVSREVSLLPRHWEWLETQSRGSVSAALRRLVELDSREHRLTVAAQQAREAVGTFMWCMAGDFPDFEEATRALYARRDDDLRAGIADWPGDVRAQVEQMLDRAVRMEREAKKAAM